MSEHNEQGPRRAIRNDDTIAPGTLVRYSRPKKGVVYEVLETKMVGKYLAGRLRHTGTGSVGWHYLDLMHVVTSTAEPGDLS